MHRYAFAALSAMAILLALAAHRANARAPLTEMEVIGSCINADQVGRGGGCGPDRLICESIRQVLRTQHANAQDCSDACAQSVRSIQQYHPSFGCPRTLSRGVTLCRKYCRTNYGE